MKPRRPHNLQRRLQARMAMIALNAKRASLPKCGATRRTDGGVCGNLPAHGSNRCRLHGGKTPRGKNWHKRTWPNGDAPGFEQKLARKLADNRKQDRQRAKRVAAMSPEERERHAAWQRAHKPGSAAERAMRRKEREDAAWFRERMLQDEAERPAAEAPNWSIFD